MHLLDLIFVLFGFVDESLQLTHRHEAILSLFSVALEVFLFFLFLFVIVANKFAVSFKSVFVQLSKLLSFFNLHFLFVALLHLLVALRLK